MTYSQFLAKLGRLRLAQIGRLTYSDYDVALIAEPNEVVFPFPFKSYRIILDNGPDSEIDEEIIDALLRCFGKTRAEFDPPN